MSETEFQERVVSWLLESFARIEREPTLDSGRRPDFIAHTPFKSYVIEVEDTSGSQYTGIGQAAVYAAETGHTPVVVFPADDPPDVEEIEGILIETV